MDHLLTQPTVGGAGPHGRSECFQLGFTLIEVLVALAVLTISLTAIYRLQSQTLMMSEKARFYTMAPLLAQAKINELEGGEYGSLADASGDFTNEQPGYSWSMRTEEVPNELMQHQRYRFVRIDMTITQSDDQSYVLRTYRLYPE